MTVHTFGAYFGLMVSRILHQSQMDKRKEQQDVGPLSDVFAVFGTELKSYSAGITDMVVEGPSPMLGKTYKPPRRVILCLPEDLSTFPPG